MTEGVGGSTAEQELAAMVPQKGYVPIAVEERLLRIEHAQRLMREQGIDALYLNASSSLFYFPLLRILECLGHRRNHGYIQTFHPISDGSGFLKNF